MKTSLNVLDGPCVFCGYNGAGYYQEETHREYCHWYHVGGCDERETKLRKVIEDISHHAFRGEKVCGCE